MSDETVESIPGEVKQSHYKVEIWGRKKDKEFMMSNEEIKIQSDIRDHHAFEPMPYFEPSKELLEAYHQELEQKSKIAEFVKKRMDHHNEVLARICDNEENS